MNKEKSEQHIPLGVKVPPSLKAEVDKAASEVWKSRSEWVRNVIVQALVNQDDYESNN